MREEDFQFDFSKNCSVFHFFLRVHSCSCCEEDQFGTDPCSIISQIWPYQIENLRLKPPTCHLDSRFYQN